MNDMTPYNMLRAAGLPVDNLRVTAHAPPMEVEGEDARQAVATGVIHTDPESYFTVIGTTNGSEWQALSFVSTNIRLVLDQLSDNERERLRAQTLTPTGLSGPVGQDAVKRLGEAVPVAPPLPPLDTAESVNADEEVLGGVEVVGTCPECNGPVLKGPGGVQEAHDPSCSHDDPNA